MFLLRIFLCWLVSSLPALAQVDLRTDYQPLQSQAPIPQNILLDAYQKTDAQTAQSGRRKRAERSYTSQVNYQLDQLLRSPLVLFNTEINALCDRLLDRLCAGDTALRERITVYLVRSSAVNAFSTDRGDIFINIGLLDRLNTENELAFVLAHELIHARERHSVQNFDFSRESGDRLTDGDAANEQLLREAQFSQELETEADLDGLKLYLAAGFDPAAPARVLQLLDRAAYLPDRWAFDSLQLIELGLGAHHPALPDTTTFVESDTTEIAEATARFGSHPATEERLRAIQVRTQLDTTRTNAAPPPSAAFAELLDVLHFELLETYVLEGFYPAALYQALWLRERYPDNAWLQESLLYAVYGIGQRAGRDLPPILADYDAGEFGRLIQYLNRLDATERALAAVAVLHEAARGRAETALVPLLYRDAAEDLRYHDRFDPTVFDAETTAGDTSRYAYLADSYRPLLRDSTFRRHLTRGERYYADNPENMEAKEQANYIRQRKAQQRKRLENGYRLGEEALIVVEPRHYTVDKRGRLRLERSERRENRLRENLRDVSELHPLRTEVLDSRANMQPDAIEDYRDSRLLTQWLYQLQGEGFRIPRNHLSVLALQERRGDPAIMYLVNVRRTVPYNGIINLPLVLLAAAAPPTAGLMLPLRNAVTRSDRTYVLVLDPRDIRTPMRQEFRQQMMGSQAAQRQTLYWIFNQINRRP